MLDKCFSCFTKIIFLYLHILNIYLLFDFILFNKFLDFNSIFRFDRLKWLTSNLFSGFSTGPSDLIASLETSQKIEEILKNGKQEVSNILSDMHGGRFINDSGRSNGEELENKIMGVLSEINKKISELTKKLIDEDALPRAKRGLINEEWSSFLVWRLE